MRYCTGCGEESSTPFCGYCGAKWVPSPESDAVVGSGVMDGSTGQGAAAGEASVAVSQEAAGWPTPSSSAPSTTGATASGTGAAPSDSAPSSTEAAARTEVKPGWCQKCGRTVVRPGAICRQCGWHRPIAKKTIMPSRMCPRCKNAEVRPNGRCPRCGWRSPAKNSASNTTSERFKPRRCPRCGETDVRPGARCTNCDWLDPRRRPERWEVPGASGRPVSGYGAGRTGERGPGRRPVAAPLPTIAATVWISIFFGLFGLIPATMHTNQAMMQGRPTNKYWKAFGWSIGITWGAVILLYVIIIAAVASSVSSYGY